MLQLLTGTLQFIDSSKNATGWYWDFGDGTNSTVKNPTHTYSVAGVYTVTLTAINANGNASKDTTITVLPVYVYVTNSGDNTVSLIDTTTKEVSTLSVGTSPFGVAVMPDGTTYVTNSGNESAFSSSVSLIDNATRNVTNMNLGTYTCYGELQSIQQEQRYMLQTMP
jgi:YVTN family beta-propeller protein